jgi:hypothetical protein
MSQADTLSISESSDEGEAEYHEVHNDALVTLPASSSP